VFIGLAVVWLLWRNLRVQGARVEAEVQRNQIEASKLVVEQVDRVSRDLGSPEEAMRAGRLIEFYETFASRLGVDEISVKHDLMRAERLATLRALVEESVERGVPCRFLDPSDYDRFIEQCSYPGLEPPKYDVDCSVACKWFMEVLSLPLDASTCPFCGAPTKRTNEKINSDAHARWVGDNRQWQLWKKRHPREAAEEEAAENAL
jgi:hypothetical protein